MQSWPKAERYLSQIDSAAQPLTETEPALIHLVARGSGSSAAWGIGGHSALIIEYIKDGYRYIVYCDIQAERLDSITDGLITQIQHVEKSAPLKKDYGLHKFFLPYAPKGIASWRVSFHRAESLLNNIKQDVVRTAKALANIFLKLEEELDRQKLIEYLRPYNKFFQLNRSKKDDSSSYADSEIHWLGNCAGIDEQIEYSPNIGKFMEICSIEITKNTAWIKYFITTLYREEIQGVKKVIYGREILENCGLMPYRITGSGKVFSVWHSKPREDLNDPLNCCEWTQEHLFHKDVNIDIYTRKSTPTALTANCAIT